MKTTFLLLGGTFIQLAAAIPAAEAHLPLRGFPPTVHGIGNSFQDGCIVPTKHHPSTVYSPPFTSALVSPTTLRTVPSAIPTSVSHGTHSSSTSKPAPKPSGGGGKAITGKNPYTTNGIKAGLSGYPKINLYSTEGMNAFAPYIGWYSDYTPSTPDYGKVQGIPMVSFLIIRDLPVY